MVSKSCVSGNCLQSLLSQEFRHNARLFNEDIVHACPRLVPAFPPDALPLFPVLELLLSRPRRCPHALARVAICLGREPPRAVRRQRALFARLAYAPLLLLLRLLELVRKLVLAEFERPLVGAQAAVRGRDERPERGLRAVVQRDCERRQVERRPGRLLRVAPE